MRSEDLRQRLKAKQGMNLRQWADFNGYNPDALRSAISDWRHRKDKPPGGDTLIMLLKLSKDIGAKVSPALANLEYKETHDDTK